MFRIAQRRHTRGQQLDKVLTGFTNDTNHVDSYLIGERIFTDTTSPIRSSLPVHAMKRGSRCCRYPTGEFRGPLFRSCCRRDRYRLIFVPADAISNQMIYAYA